MRQLLPGHGASRGSALGRARVRLPHVLDVREEHIDADLVENELDRLHAAIDVVREEMRVLRQRLHGALAQEVGEFLDLHALLLDDPELLHGLDDISLQSSGTASGGDGLSSQVVVFGKRISDRLSLGYEQGLTLATSAIRLEYALSRRVTLRAEAGAVSGVGIAYRRSFQ